MLNRLLRKRKPARPIDSATVPEGRRVYAIGDVHGRNDLLQQLLQKIVMDDGERGAAKSEIIFLGDLVDRGPDSAGVLDTAMQLVVGDYAFVHAGIRPGLPLSEQRKKDLRWIREEFLATEAAHEKVIVYGHTISDEVVEAGNRIGIDTGAYYSNKLTALALQGSERWYLDTST